MGVFSAPKRLTRGDVVLSVGVTLAVTLFLPDREVARMGHWTFGLFVALPFSFVAGLMSSWIYYGKNDSNSIDPFYLRACWAVIGGAAAWPVCLILRPLGANFAFCTFTFGLGPVIAFHVYQRVRKPKRIGRQTQRGDMGMMVTIRRFALRNVSHQYDAGTRIRFLKTLSLDRTANHPQVLLADVGEEGTITGYASPRCYWVKVNATPNNFGAWEDEFEAVSPMPRNNS